MSNTTMRWFGARSLFAMRLDGEAAPTLVEERVVLFRAESSEQAIGLAEAEAVAYVADFSWTNAEGKRVAERYLGCIDVYDMGAEPASGVEVFSTTVVVNQPMTDDELVERFSGEATSAQDTRVRRRFEPG